jgi:hypothetical protein
MAKRYQSRCGSFAACLLADPDRRLSVSLPALAWGAAGAAARGFSTCFVACFVVGFVVGFVGGFVVESLDCADLEPSRSLRSAPPERSAALPPCFVSKSLASWRSWSWLDGSQRHSAGTKRDALTFGQDGGAQQLFVRQILFGQRLQLGRVDLPQQLRGAATAQRGIGEAEKQTAGKLQRAVAAPLAGEDPATGQALTSQGQRFGGDWVVAEAA